MSETKRMHRTMTRTTLHRWQTSAVTAADAVSAYQSLLADDTTGTAIFSTPRKCVIGRIGVDSITGFDNSSIPANCGYEIRAFSPNFELRWLQDGPATGNAVLLGENSAGPTDDRWAAMEELPAHRLDELQYLIWGTCERSNGDWAVMSDARISELHVPALGVVKGDRLVVSAVEYLTQLDDDGNVGVIEERLISVNKYQ